MSLANGGGLLGGNSVAVKNNCFIMGLPVAVWGYHHGNNRQTGFGGLAVLGVNVTACWELSGKARRKGSLGKW
jgi:hypothetical protein